MRAERRRRVGLTERLSLITGGAPAREAFVLQLFSGVRSKYRRRLSYGK
jgi:hypothetical protein